MANQEHLDILKQGVEVWNRWREAHPDVQPDLIGANLNDVNLSYANLINANLINTNFSHANLSNTNLNEANLSYTNLISANLINANLSYTNLINANLSDTNLNEANLSYANLINAILSNAILNNANLNNTNLSYAILNDTNLNDTNLSYASLSHADLSHANLSSADLNHANLNDTDLSYAILNHNSLGGVIFREASIGSTTFADVDLSKVEGLETAKHWRPSAVGIDTIYRSGGNIPESFLRGAGVPETFITYARSLINNPIEYYTCFISYSSRDQAFAERLYADLQNNNVRCWYAPEDMKIGDKFRVRIDESIRLYDKLLLILSEHSVASPWVETEVEMAFRKENKTGKLALFPVKLDNTVTETDQPWAADIQNRRHIGDFTHWKEHDEYQKGLTRLLRDLKQEALHDTIESDVDQD